MKKLKFIDDEDLLPNLILGKIYDGIENDKGNRYILTKTGKMYYKWRFKDVTREFKIKKLLC